MTNKIPYKLILLFLVVVAMGSAVVSVSAQRNNDWWRRQQQQQQIQQQRQLEQQRQQQRQQMQQQMREQMRQQMQQQMRQQMQQQMQQQMRQQMQQQQRKQLGGTSLRANSQGPSAAVVSKRSDQVLYSNGVAKLTRPLTPGEMRRGFTGRVTQDGRALVNVNGRVLAVPAARVGIKLRNARAAQSTQWTASKRASISSEIQRLAGVKLKYGSGGGGRRPPTGGGNGGGGSDPRRVAANDNKVTILGRGSTGRTQPRNIKEKVAMQQAMANPNAGEPIKMAPMGDPRWPAKDGWVKMRQHINGVRIHYVRNKNTLEVDDFKFVDPKKKQ